MDIYTQYVEMLQERRDNKDESLLHREDWIPKMLYLPIGKHMQLHSDGLKAIREMKEPSIITEQELKQFYHEVLFGRLEHWCCAPLEGTTVGRLAMEGVKHVG
jgi:hypothetical protein